MWMWAAVLRLLKHVVPMPTLVRLAQRAPRAGAERLRDEVETYLGTKGRFPFRPPANCLERSLGAYRLLCEAGADPELVVGVKRSDGRVDGHVWVSVDGHAVGEERDLETFTTIVTFDANARQRTAAGFDGALSRVRVR
jgi:hypothetical protein